MTGVGTRPARIARGLRLFFLAVAVLFAGCGGNTRIIYGTAVLTMKDTSGRFLSYQINIDAITLTRSDGIVVQPLASPQVVDITKLDNLGELIGSPAVPVGSYTAASITLDYTNASIWVDENGQAVQLAPVNTAGTSMTVAVMTVSFDASNPLVINSQQSTRLHLDIDLAASNTVNATAATPQVVVQPIMYAAPAALDNTLLRARGLYVTEMSVPSGFIMNARPFVDEISAMGAEQVNTTAQTYFNINGAVYVGAAGLAALAQLPENSTVAAYGTLADLSGTTPVFSASAVYAGLSLQTPLADELTGVVSARSGNVLTVRAATLFTTLLQLQFFNSATVTVGSGTQVTADGVALTGLTDNSVSVGQQVTVFGQGSVNSSSQLNIDATAGAVRLQPTRLWGTLLPGATASSASLNLQALQNLEPGVFNFAGTGLAGQDANPQAYTVDTAAATSLSGIAGSPLVAVDGLVTGYGSAPPDFTASAVTLGTATPQTLLVQWNTGATAPFSSISAAGLVVNLTNGKLTTQVIRSGPINDLTQLPAGLLISTANVPASSLQLAVGLPASSATAGTSNDIQIANSTANFVSALNSGLSSSSIYSLVAIGQYDSVHNTFNASQINVNLY